MEKLIKKLKTTIDEVDGTWSVVLNDITHQKQWKINEHDLHYAASIIKVPIMATVFSLADKGQLSMSEKIIMKPEDQVGGSGVLQHLTPNEKISIADLTILMIIQSDNTATNMLIDVVGVENIQQTMEHIGMEKSTFYNKLMIVPADLEGSNKITANDMSIMLNQMLLGKISSYYACEKMIDMMKKQQIHYLTKNLPNHSSEYIGTERKWQFASKTGNVTGTKHDMGILYVNGKIMTVTVLSSQCDKEVALETLSNIGRYIFQYLSQE